MRYDTETRGDGLSLRMHDRFTFSDYPAFRKLCEDIEKSHTHRVEIDMSEIEFLDSSAIGMLLILHDEMSSRQGNLTVTRPRGQVRRALEIASAKTLLNIVDIDKQGG